MTNDRNTMWKMSDFQACQEWTFPCLLGLYSFLIMHPRAAEPRDLEKSMVIDNVFCEMQMFLSSNENEVLI